MAGKIADWVNRSPEKIGIRPICRGKKLAKSTNQSRENITKFGSWLRVLSIKKKEKKVSKKKILWKMIKDDK